MSAAAFYEPKLVKPPTTREIVYVFGTVGSFPANVQVFSDKHRAQQYLDTFLVDHGVNATVVERSIIKN